MAKGTEEVGKFGCESHQFYVILEAAYRSHSVDVRLPYFCSVHWNAL